MRQKSVLTSEYSSRFLRPLKVLLLGLLWITTLATYAQTISVSSIEDMMPYFSQSNVSVRLTGGTHTINSSASSTIFMFSGNNSTYDFGNATVNISTSDIWDDPNNQYSADIFKIHIIGSNNVVKWLNLNDVGETVPEMGVTGAVLDGSNNTLYKVNMTCRGSFPYGYGDIYGKGGNGTMLPMRKHSGIQVRGSDNTVDDCKVYMRAFGHGIFIQGAKDAVINNCYVEGELRSTNDIRAEGNGETNVYSSYETTWGYDIPSGYMLSLAEDGIRTYASGGVWSGGVNGSDSGTSQTENVTITNCTIKRMRSGVAIYAGAGTKTVQNCTALECESGFSTSSYQKIENCKGDAAYGPLFTTDYASVSNIEVDVTLTSNWALSGQDQVVYVGGSDHSITVNSNVSANSNQIINSGARRYGIRFIQGTTIEYQAYQSADGVFFDNNTDYTLRLNHNVSNCTGTSDGSVIDVGSNNSINGSPQTNSINSSGGNPMYQLRKRNSSGYAIDGNNGGDDGQNVYLWSQNAGNQNQQWIEIDRGNGYYSYQKRGTNYCLDGNNGGDDGQNVYLWTCGSSNQNQHWSKIDRGSGHYQLQKRNSSSYCLDGNNGGGDGQNLYLWTCKSWNQNQQWYFNQVGTSNRVSDDLGVEIDMEDTELTVYPNPVQDLLKLDLVDGRDFSDFSIVSINGQVMTKGALDDKATVSFDVSSFPVGLYTLILKGADGLAQIKFAKR